MLTTACMGHSLRFTAQTPGGKGRGTSVHSRKVNRKRQSGSPYLRKYHVNTPLSITKPRRISHGQAASMKKNTRFIKLGPFGFF